MQYLTVEQLSVRLSIEPKVIKSYHRKRCADPIPRTKLGRSTVYDWDSKLLQAWIQRRIHTGSYAEQSVTKEVTTMRPRNQKGYLFQNKSGTYWKLRYWVDEIQDAKIIRRQRVHTLCTTTECQTKKAAELRAQDYLKPHNTGSLNPRSTLTLEEFFQTDYRTYMGWNCKPATVAADTLRWKNHVAGIIGQVRVCDFQPADGQRLIDSLVTAGKINRGSLQRIRSLLSGVLRIAINKGLIPNGVNPMRCVITPRRDHNLQPPRPTYAYNRQQFDSMLGALSDPDRTIVAVLYLTGIRPGELTALDWDDWQDGHLAIWKSDWEGHVEGTKNDKARKVPVNDELAGILNDYRQRNGQPGLIFQHQGKRVSLRNRAKPDRPLQRTLAAKGIPWYGWYALRRGCASTLKARGADSQTIQKLLGHACPQTTERHYIQLPDATLVAAVNTLTPPACEPAQTVQ